MMQEKGFENHPYLCRSTPWRRSLGGTDKEVGAVKKIDREERVSEFELDAWIFLERVKALAHLGLEETGGLPCGKEGKLFDLLDACCEAFEGRLRKAVEGESLAGS